MLIQTLSPLELAYCIAVLVFNFMLRGSLGFGGALGLPLLALALPVKVLAPAWSLIGIVSSIAIIGHGRRHVDRGEFVRLLPGCALGILAGLFVFKALDAAVLARALGVFILAYAAYSWWKPAIRSPLVRPAASFFAGVSMKRGVEGREVIVFNNNAANTVDHPVDGRRMKPKFLGGDAPAVDGKDPRQALATWLTSRDNAAFCQTMANVIWAHFFGRGIVEPVDDVRISNPPSNKELLEEIGARDIAWLRPGGGEMLHDDWYDHSLHALGLVLHGNAIEESGPHGEAIVGDSLALLLNAGPETVEFDLALHAKHAPRWWETLVDTANPPDNHAAAHDPQTLVRVPSRTLLLLRELPPE